MLEAPFRLVRGALPHMYGRGWGRVVNISSVHGLRASPYKSAYVTAKHGLEGLSKVIALEGAEHGVTSNCVNPAYVRTPLVEGQIADQARTPPVVARANALLEENQALGFDDEDAILALYRDPALRERHEAMLPPPPTRRRGDIDPEHVLAQAKIMDAVSIHDAVSWLKPKERMVVLHDRALLDQLTRLKPVAEPAE